MRPGMTEVGDVPARRLAGVQLRAEDPAGTGEQLGGRHNGEASQLIGGHDGHPTSLL
jgi:hypothetical protein